MREWQLSCIDAFDRIAGQVDRAIKVLGTGPGPSALGQRSERFSNSNDRGIAAMASGKGNDVIAMRPDDRQRLVVAMREYVGKPSAEFQQMMGPGQFQMAAVPILCEAVPIGRLQLFQHGCA